MVLPIVRRRSTRRRPPAARELKGCPHRIDRLAAAGHLAADRHAAAAEDTGLALPARAPGVLPAVAEVEVPRDAAPQRRRLQGAASSSAAGTCPSAARRSAGGWCDTRRDRA